MTDVELSLETPIVSTVHHPFGRPGGPGLWRVKGMELPAYIQNIGHALLRTGRAHSVSQAIQMAVGICKNWASGQAKVGPEVRAAAAKAIAEWEAKKVRAHATHHTLSEVRMYDAWGKVIDLAVQGSPTAAQRKSALKQGKALPHPSGSPGQARFPITNATLLGRAIRMVQLAKGDKTAIRRYIMARARAMGLSSMIPAHWKPDGTMGVAP